MKADKIMEVERGRYVGLKLDERVCKLCKNNLIEDEMHVLMYCSRDESARNSLLSKIEEIFPAAKKMKNILYF